MHSHDLFDFVSVSLQEIELWLFTVPRIVHTRRGRAASVRNYAVVEKIKRAKLAGTLENILGNGLCEFCGQTICQEQDDIYAPVSPVDEVARLQRRVAVLEVVIRAQAAAASLPAMPASLRGRLPRVS